MVHVATQVQQEALAKEYVNARYEQPYQTALYEAGVLLHHRRWHTREYEEAVGKLTAPDLEVRSASCAVPGSACWCPSLRRAEPQPLSEVLLTMSAESARRWHQKGGEDAGACMAQTLKT